ncbi:hypothetical protein L1F30_02035 [Simiduia sp. 21SJ11W-1]|uniref:hypothetical protein n=1 Tax=Simiduia sp. 21SJ11W-1 TaxID=2909669 RepID=UPI00209CD10E|nr:hypothetical protein [Simiduia sp. 21SJ11W-1]UTA48335.1 hypothetical protein L1F30_02035 [Simiduia sp. 21SJ11W-1]
MKLVKLALIVGAFFLMCNQANALSIVNYKQLKKEDYSSLKLYVSGLGQGYDWSNSIVANKLKQNLYCPPQKIALNAENFLSIIDTEIESGLWKDEDPIEMILFFGLEKTFACE